MTDSLADDVAAVARIDAVPLILDVVCRTTGMRFAAIARVTEDRWVACAVYDRINFGLQPGGELRVETTICHEVRGSEQLVVIDNVAESPIYCGHPTPKMYGFQSYISVPIFRPDGAFFGTLCAIDPEPARLDTPETLGTFKLFADLIGFHLAAQDRLSASEAALIEERQNSELREQFIAVLGHDLRNPLTAIDAGTRMLRKLELGSKAEELVQLIQQSAGRAAGLIDNVLEFSRARLGGGLQIERSLALDLETVLRQVIAELEAVHPNRTIQAEFALSRPFACDSGRIGQLLSNLVANALVHGAPEGPIRIMARTASEEFQLAVANPGAPIPPATIERLFQPFVRASARPGQQGLGLGLFIANEIARAHEGALDVVSNAEETCFTLRIPLATAAELER